MKSNDEWRELDYINPIYIVNRDGTIKNKKTNNVISHVIKNNCPKVYLFSEQGTHYYKVAEIVATMFIPNPYDSYTVGFKDNDKFNVRADNLVWIDDNEKTDCFAYSEKRCLALTEKLCKKRECPFYKTREQYVKGINKVNARLLKLWEQG